MSSIFFEKPLNTTPKLATDGRKDTFLTNASITMNVDSLGTGIGAARPFTHILLISSGVTSYAVTASGGNVIGLNVTLHTYDTGGAMDLIDSSGYDVNPVIDGLHYDLFQWHSSGQKPTAKYLTFSLVGSNIKVYQLLVLNAILEIEDGGFSDFQFIEQLPGIEQRSARGRRSVAPPIAGDRSRHRIALVVEPKRGNRTDEVSRAVDAFMAKYPEFAFALEYSRFPNLVFEAMNGDQESRYEYVSQWKARGRRSRFVIQEL